MKYYLSNPLANNGIGAEVPSNDVIDVTKIDYPEFFAGLKDRHRESEEQCLYLRKRHRQ